MHEGVSCAVELRPQCPRDVWSAASRRRQPDVQASLWKRRPSMPSEEPRTGEVSVCQVWGHTRADADASVRPRRGRRLECRRVCETMAGRGTNNPQLRRLRGDLRIEIRAPVKPPSNLAYPRAPSLTYPLSQVIKNFVRPRTKQNMGRQGPIPTSPPPPL